MKVAPIERMFETAGVGTNSHDRDLRRARVGYVGAVRQLEAALWNFEEAGVPLDPGRGPQPRPWTAHHVAVLRELVAALIAVLDRRREWDGMRREWRPPH